MTVKKRITLLVALTGVITNLLFSVVIFFELIEQPFDILDRALKEEATRVVQLDVSEQGDMQRLPGDAIRQNGYPFWLTIHERGSNRIQYQSFLAKQVKLPQIKAGASTITWAKAPIQQLNPDQNASHNVPFRIKTFDIPFENKTFIVQIARSMEELQEEIWELIFSIGAGLFLSCMTLVVISHFIAGKILEPIGKMKDLTLEISEKNLDQRIPTGPDPDEFNELARTINWMLDRLQNSFVRQREFLFDTSHELKTPLTTMRLVIDEIYTSETGTLHAQVKEKLLILNNHVLRMERLVKDLLNLSSLETQTGIDAKPIDISEMISTLAEDYHLLAKDRNIQLKIKLTHPLIIQGDKRTLTRAFSNLLDNAIKFNVDGGQVEVDNRESDETITLSVANTGPGVPEDEISKVFDQFYRLEHSRSVKYGGSGLGLAIVKRTVELHNGQITFNSKPNDWTRVTVCLPTHHE